MTKCSLVPYYEQHLEVAREIGDHLGEGIALNNLYRADPAHKDGYRQLASEYKWTVYRGQAFEFWYKFGDQLGIPYPGVDPLHCLCNDYAAIDYNNQRLFVAHEIRDRRGEAICLHNLGGIYSTIGEIQHAITYYEVCITLFCETGDITSVADNSWDLGMLYESQGDLIQTLPLFEAAARHYQEIGHVTHAEQSVHKLEEVKCKITEQIKLDLPLVIQQIIRRHLEIGGYSVGEVDTRLSAAGFDFDYCAM
jgi:tetratricopeptide (TPR) repeat protein